MQNLDSINLNFGNMQFIAIVSTIALALLISASYSFIDDVFGQSNLTDSANIGNSNEPDINAAAIFNTKTITLGSNIKNLVILIPNEGHHAAGEDKEARFLDQHFVPENAVINKGTSISWFNGDVGHERTIDVKDANGNTLFNTGKIVDSQPSKSFTFDNPGVFNYEAEGDAGVTMRGTITVQDSLSSLVAGSEGNTSLDTVGILMVPTQDINTYNQEIQSAGLTVDSMYDFKDLRGGQKGTGDVQTLIVWTSGGKDLSSIFPPISDLSSSLPYS